MNSSRKEALGFIQIASVLLLATLSSNAQAPGGVAQPVLWESDIQSGLSDHDGGRMFNYHTYSYFNEDRGFLEYDLPTFDKITFFLVYSSGHPDNQIAILNSENSELLVKDSVVMSTKNISYQAPRGLPNFITYKEYVLPNMGKNDMDPNILIGSKIAEDNWLEGGIAELIVYDRLLGEKHIDKVESYLAVKYGIPLPDSISYYNSDGDTIWDPLVEEGFVHDQMILGCDIGTSLNQKQTRSLYSDIPMSISIGKLENHNRNNHSELIDNTYTIIADNGLPSDLKSVGLSEYQKEMKRIWKISSYGERDKATNLSISIDPKSINGYDNNLKTWLTIASTKEDLNQGIKHLLVLSPEGLLQTDFDVDTGASDSVHFTIEQSPSQYLEVNKYKNDCEEQSSLICLELKGPNSTKSTVLVWRDDKLVLERDLIPFDKTNIGKLPYGEYKIILSNDQGNRHYYVTTSMEDCFIGKDYKLYPNPVQIGSQFNLEFSSGSLPYDLLTVSNSAGEILMNRRISQSQRKFSSKLYDAVC